MKKKILPLYKAEKRKFLLLEILIALILISFCALPLISPHIVLMRAQKEFISALDLDRYVSIIYVDFLERLHKKDGELWSSLKSNRTGKIDDRMLERLHIPKNFPFNGEFSFKEIKTKSNEESGWGAHRISLTFTFSPKTNTESKENLVFPYEFTYLQKSYSKATDDDEEEKDAD